MLTSWILEDLDTSTRQRCVGHFNAVEKSLTILHRLSTCDEVIQATVNSTATLLVYIVKRVCHTKENLVEIDNATATGLIYQAFIVEVKPDHHFEPWPITQKSSKKQIMAQFLWKKAGSLDKIHQEKFLLLTHEECKLFK